MLRADLCIHPADVIAPIDDRLYSSFIEHMGRAVYTGIYEPAHPTADTDGFRQDVIALIKPLRLPLIRYPGGNFLSGYRWQDGIGPKESRPVRPDLAWQAIEPNQVGTDEFMRFCGSVGAAPMMGVNLGTGTPQDAVDLLEYCNGQGGTYFADLRRQNGHAAPYNVKTWCLGNEMDGPWQIGGKTADEYGRIACETAKMMKWYDPSVELVACGSSFRSMPTFGTWERTVLAHCYPHIDYLSLHQYYQNLDGDIGTFLARSLEMDAFIREVAGICREMQQKTGAENTVQLSFDEWNVWYHWQKERCTAEKWIVGRPVEEERYDFADALLVGLMLNTLIRNADTVKIACLAQLVNALAAVMTEPGGRAWAQTIYYPFLYTSRYGRGMALRAEAASPVYASAVSDRTPYLDAAAVLGADEGTLTVFLVNRHLTKPLSCTLDISGRRPWHTVQAEGLFGHASDAVNTAGASPVTPQPWNGVTQTGNRLDLLLPPASWCMVRLMQSECGN